jgi:hypothetical protein
MENYVLRWRRVLVLSGFPFPPCDLPFFVGLFACLDFGPCPLVSFKSENTTNADIFPPSKSQSNSIETVTNSKLDDLQ